MASIKGRYARIEIPLGTAETGKELHITGDYLSIISITGEGTCEVKLDHRHAQTIDLREITSIIGRFEKLYFTTDGAGGKCSLFVGNGLSIQVLPDPQKIWSGGTAGIQITTPNVTVASLASEPYKLKEVAILNSNGIYSCFVGVYASNPATFKAYASVLLPHKTLKFNNIDMYTLGCISYDGVNTVDLHILGTYD